LHEGITLQGGHARDAIGEGGRHDAAHDRRQQHGHERERPRHEGEGRDARARRELARKPRESHQQQRHHGDRQPVHAAREQIEAATLGVRERLCPGGVQPHRDEESDGADDK